jgi:hypothetical protein
VKNLLVLSGLVVFTAFPLEAVVLVHALPEPLDIYTDFEPMISDFFPYDIEGNGTIDFTFIGDPSAAGLRTERGNRLVITIDPPPNIGGPVASISSGSLIGLNSLAQGSQWISSDILGGFVSPDELVANEIIQVFFSGHATNFTERSVIGFEFEAEDGIHYGYFDISPAPYIAPRITLHGWAWETQPGVPIVAGRVPEPSALTLAIVTTASILSRRRR